MDQYTPYHHLVCIAEGDEPKMAFRTHYGSFKWRVMPFGLSNAPAVFQQFINDVLEGLLDVCAIGYIDDILVYSDSLEEHKDHVQEVLQQLQDAGLYANAKKCIFHTNMVEYLGFILSPEGLRMDPATVSSIQAWLVPRNVHEVQSFLGFANFYQRFISSYAEFTQPLTNLCWKNTPWHFGEPESTAFQHLKTAFRTAPVLYHWVPDLPMTVETDASDYAIAGILSVTTPDLEIRPIAFHSRSLHDAERNYDTHDKKLLAVFDCYKAWRHYLEGSGHPIDTVTDHKNLEYFTSTKKLTHQQALWSEYLSQFNLRIHFCPGRLGTKPDALTHRSDVHPGSRPDTTPTNVHPLFTPQQLETPTSCTSILDHPPGGLLETLDQFQIWTEVAQHLSSDTFALMVKRRLRDQHSLPGWEWKEECLWYEGCIYVPEPLCLQLICNHHDHPMAGHFGHHKTINLICQSCHWPGLTRMVKQYIQSCMVCTHCRQDIGLL